MPQNNKQFVLKTISFVLAISILLLGIVTEIYPSTSADNLTPSENTLANKSLFQGKNHLLDYYC